MKETDDLLKKGLDELGIPWTGPQIDAFRIFLFELKKWNRIHNLTGLTTDRDIIVKHFLDSLLFLKALPDSAAAVADIGSGAGFPGIPIKIIATRLKMVLLEPAGKKAVFLRHICSRLGMGDVEIVEKRLEEVRGLRVDAAVTRALYSIREFIEKTEGIVGSGGVLILSKGPKLTEELRGIEMRDIAVLDFDLPFAKTLRHLIVVRR
jgi:16S rRNA (guanine527-N7)-methyltransferase